MARTGAQYIDGLKDGRTVYVNGERVADVTEHPAFRAAVRSIAQLYDLAASPEHRETMTFPSPATGEPVNKCFLIPRTRDDLAARRHAHRLWADATFGFMGRSPTTSPASSPASPCARTSSRGTVPASASTWSATTPGCATTTSTRPT